MEQLTIDLTVPPRRGHRPVVRDAPWRESLVGVEAVAERLGVTVRHVRRLVADDRIPYFKWGKPLRFDPAEIDAWLERARRGASPI